MFKLYTALLLAVVSILVLISRLYDAATAESHFLYPQEEAFLELLFSQADPGSDVRGLPLTQAPLAQLALPQDIRSLLLQGKVAVLQDEAQGYYFYKLQTGSEATPSALVSVVGPIYYPPPQEPLTHWLWELAAYVLLALALLLLCWPLYRDVKKLQHHCRHISNVNFATKSRLGRSSMLKSIGDTMDQMADKLAFHTAQQRDFLNAVSHDFLTPLARMKFALATIPNTPASADTVQGLKSDVTELECLIDEFLSYAELTQYQPQLQLQQFSATDVVQHCFDRIKPLVDVRCAIDADIEQICTDKSCFERIMLNLISNAMRYAKSEVRVSIRQQQGIEITVEDDGPGFNAAEADTLTQAFKQGRLSAQQFYRGSGLGLPTVVLLCNHVGAQFALGKSAVLQGASVRISLAA